MHGSKDRNPPVELIRYITARLPYCPLKEFPEDTHFTLHQYLDEIFLGLAPKGFWSHSTLIELRSISHHVYCIFSKNLFNNILSLRAPRVGTSESGIAPRYIFNSGMSTLKAYFAVARRSQTASALTFAHQWRCLTSESLCDFFKSHEKSFVVKKECRRCGNRPAPRARGPRTPKMLSH